MQSPGHCRSMLAWRATSSAMRAIQGLDVPSNTLKIPWQICILFSIRQYYNSLSECTNSCIWRTLWSPLCMLNYMITWRSRPPVSRCQNSEMGTLAIDYHNDLAMKTNEQLDIGFTTRTVLRKLTDDGHDMNKIRQLFSGFRLFYVDSCKYTRSN